jgi:hypothetical protein
MSGKGIDAGASQVAGPQVCEPEVSTEQDFGSNSVQQTVLAAATGAPDPSGVPPLDDAQQERKETLCAAVLQRVSGPVTDMWNDIRGLTVAEVDPAVRTAVWADPVFRSNAVWRSKPFHLRTVLQLFSPIEQFRRDLRTAHPRGDAEVLSVVRAWVADNRSLCAPAISEGILDFVVNRVTDEALEYDAVCLLLFQGTLPQGQTADLQRALSAGDAERFRGAWVALCADTDAALQFADDPNWLYRVQDKLGDASYQMVLVDVRRFSAAGNASAVQGQIAPLIDGTIASLAELNDTFHVSDAVVVAALRTYFAKVDELVTTGGITDPTAAEHVRDQARILLSSSWEAVHGTDLGTTIESGLQGNTETTALTLLRLSATGTSDTDEQLAAGGDNATEELSTCIREQAGKVRAQFDVMVYVDDVHALRAIQAAHDAIKSTVDARGLGAAEGRQQLAVSMRTLKTTYDELFASSLVNDIHNGIDDDSSARLALQLIGDRLDPNARDIADLSATASPEQMEDASARLETLSLGLRDLAEKFHDEVFDTFVSASYVKGLCAIFARTKLESADLVELIPSWTDARCLQMLEAHFQAIGGDLRTAISSGLGVADSDIAFGSLGLQNQASAMRVDGDARSVEQIRARDRVDSMASDVFVRAISLKVPTAGRNTDERDDQESERELDLDSLYRRLTRYAEAKRTWEQVVAPTETAQETDPFKTRTGISLPHLLSLHLLDSWECARAVDAAGLPSGSVRASQATRRDVVLDANDPELQFDYRQVTSWDFSLTMAKERARELHRVAYNDGALAVRLTEQGSPEENRIVLEIFTRMYGYDVDYLVNLYHGINSENAENMREFARTGGQMVWLENLRTCIRSNDPTQVVSKVMNATQAQLDTVLADREILHSIRSTMGQEVYDHVYRAATGQLSLGDVLRENDSDWGLWMDLGSDEEGATSGTTEFIKYVRRQFDAGTLAEMPSSQQQLLRNVFADGDTQALLAQEFSGGDLLKLQQLILHGGEQTSADKMEVDIADGATGDALLDLLGTLTSEERATRLTDPDFMRRMAATLSQQQMAYAIGILSAKPGEEYDYSLRLRGASIDEDAMMETLLGMPMDALYSRSQNAEWRGQTRRRLNAEQREVFEGLLDSAEQMFAPQSGQNDSANESLVDDPLALSCPAEEAMSQGEITRRRQHLLLTHSTRLKFAAVQGAYKVYPALQSAFSEKGEVSTDPMFPNAKEELFTSVERRQLWVSHGVREAMKEQFGEDDELYSIARSALVDGVDPSNAAVSYAFGTMSYNTEMVRVALSGVANSTLIDSWSNVNNPGENTNGASLKSAYAEYKPAYETYQFESAEAEAKCQSVSADVAETYGAALQRFRTFPLDVSAGLSTALRNDTVWSTLALNWTSAKDFLDFKMEVRKKIMAIPGSSIASSLGIAEGDPVIDMLNGVDRKARSVQVHQRDAARHQVDQRSVADFFSDTDEQLAVSFALYSGEVGRAGTAEEGELAGEITEEESTEIQARLDQFNVDIAEYRAAKDTAAEVLKWSAILIITAISAALTGPAGPSIIASIITAGAQAATVAVLTEAAQGGDYELGRDGTKAVIKDAAMAGLSAKGSQLFQRFVTGQGAGSGVRSAMDRWREWSGRIDSNVQEEFGQLGTIAWDSMKAAGSAQLDGVTDAAFSMVDPANVQYGWAYGLAQSETVFEAKIDGLPEAFWESMKEELVKNALGAARDRVTGGGASTIPGSEDGLPASTPEEQSLLSWLAGDLSDAAFKQVVDEAATRVGNGTMFEASGWDGDQVGDFLLKFAKGRASSWTQALAEQVASERNAGLTDAFKAEVRAMASSPLEGAEMERLYVAHMVAHAKSGAGYAMTPQEWERVHWQPLSRQLAQVDPEQDAQLWQDHRTWVLADPALAAERSRVPLDRFVEQRRLASNERTAVYASSQFQSMTTEQQRYYRAYLDDTGRALDQSTSSDSTNLDIRNDDGLGRYLTSFRETKRQIATPLAEQATLYWPAYQRDALMRTLQNGDIDHIPSLEPRGDCAANQEAIDAWATTWRRNLNTPAREREVVHGEFIGPR